MSGNDDTGREAETDGEGKEGKTFRRLIYEAYQKISLAGNTQFEDQVAIGRYLNRWEIDFHELSPDINAFKELAARVKEDPRFDYTERHLRNLAAFGRLYDEITGLLVAKDANRGADLPPVVSMTHYLATNKVRGLDEDRPQNANIPRALSLDKKLGLLRLARQQPWSVKQLKERVNCELGIAPQEDDEFGMAVEMTKQGIAKLMAFLSAGKEMEAKQLTDLWRLITPMVAYRTALAEVAPKGMRDSVLRDTVVLGEHGQVGQPNGEKTNAAAAKAA